MTEHQQQGAAPHSTGLGECGAVDDQGIQPIATDVPSAVLWVVQKLGWPAFPVHAIVRGQCSCSKGKDCKTPGKHPRIANGHKGSTTNPDLLSAWAQRWPGANWAASPLGGFVIDVDTRKGGFDSMQEWRDQLPSTTRVITGGGGEHLYFTLPDGIEVRQRGNWLAGVDTRTTEGYVLLPGSNHASGGTYQWGDQREPAEAPDFLIAAIGVKGDRDSGGGSSSGGRLPPTAELLNGVPFGQRDDLIFRACCRWWRQHSHHDDGGEAKVTELAFEMGRNSEPPFSDEEILAKVKSAARYALDDPKFRHTDDGNALLYVEQHASSIKFTNDSKTWFAWDGVRWVRDAPLSALDKARRTARSLVDYALELETDDQKRAQALGHAKSSLSAGRIKAMPELAKSDARLHVPEAVFDFAHDLLNTPTGTVNLRTGEFRPHRREEFHSKLTSVGYEVDAQSEWWEEWISWAMGHKPDLVEFLQRSCGYAITGETSEQGIWMHHGVGANGKSTLMNVMSGVLGDYAHTADPELLTGGHTAGLADLHGKRFVSTSEIKEGARLDEQRMKALSGEDLITARYLYKDFFTFRSTATIFWAMNHLPTITDDTYGMWRRIFVLPWVMQIPREQRQKGVADWVVKTHGAAVLKWAVDGAVKWYADGLHIPDDVLLRTEAYKNREDRFAGFIEEYLTKDPEGFATTAGIKAAYEAWCAGEKLPSKERLGSTTLLERIETRLGVNRKRQLIYGKKVWGYAGYRVSTDGAINWK